MLHQFTQRKPHVNAIGTVEMLKWTHLQCALRKLHHRTHNHILYAEYVGDISRFCHLSGGCDYYLPQSTQIPLGWLPCTGFNYKRHFAKSTYWEFHCSRSNESKNDTDDPLNILVFVARIIQLYYCDALQSFDVPTLRCFNVSMLMMALYECTFMHTFSRLFSD